MLMEPVLRLHPVRMLFALSLVTGLVPNLSAAGSESRSMTTPQQVRPTTIRWSAEHKDVINGMQRLAGEPPFRLRAQQFEQEVRRTEPMLKRARELMQNPAVTRSVYDDVIRQLQQQHATLLQLQAKMTAIDGQLRSPPSGRQLVPTYFENANQKSTQYVNMLATVIKTMNEMRMGLVRNLR